MNEDGCSALVEGVKQDRTVYFSKVNDPETFPTHICSAKVGSIIDQDENGDWMAPCQECGEDFDAYPSYNSLVTERLNAGYEDKAIRDQIDVILAESRARERRWGLSLAAGAACLVVLYYVWSL